MYIRVDKFKITKPHSLHLQHILISYRIIQILFKKKNIGKKKIYLFTLVIIHDIKKNDSDMQ